jgi:hypothetical protein
VLDHLCSQLTDPQVLVNILLLAVVVEQAQPVHLVAAVAVVGS